MDVAGLLESPQLRSLDADVHGYLCESLRLVEDPQQAAELLAPFLEEAELADEQQILRPEFALGHMGFLCGYLVNTG